MEKGEDAVMRRIGVVVAATCLAVAGCGGGGGSNDQGVSFRALGVFQESPEQFAPAADTFPTADEAVGDTGRSIDFATTQFLPTDTNGDGDLDGGFLGFENLLVNQRLNMQGVQVEIFIPGAVINPVVTDFVPLTTVLGPVPDEDSDDTANIRYSQTLFVSADVMAFLNQNPALLPPLPFNMNVVMRGEAISDSGDFFDSNEITYNVLVQ
jgi:hypothetical protein